MYDGSSGFKFCTNKKKHKKPKAAMGPLSESLKVELDVLRQEQEWTPPANTRELTADMAAWDAWVADVDSWIPKVVMIFDSIFLLFVDYPFYDWHTP